MSWVDNSYFAPRTLQDEKGRRIMWAWLFDNPKFGTRPGWSGTMSLPRVLTIGDDGMLRINPIEELDRLPYNAVTKKPIHQEIPADSELKVDTVVGNSIEIDVDMTSKDAKQYGVKVCCSPMNEEQTLVYYDAVAKKLKIDTS